MKNRKKNLAGYIFVAGFFLFLAWPIFSGITRLIEGDQKYQTLNVKLCLIGFIEKNKRFPTSELELQKKGYLKQETKDNKTIYYVNTENGRYRSKGFQPVPDFKKIKFAYGIKSRDLARKGKVIYNKRVGYERLLMIQGPWRSQKRLYRDVTYELYQELLFQLGLTDG